MEESKKILKVLCVKDLPIAIDICNIVDVPDTIDWYNYKITHIPTGNYYDGKHKWNGKAYWHSGEHIELNKLWSTEIKAFKYEITNFGSENSVSKIEAEILDKSVGKDPLCWNLTKAILKKRDLKKDAKFVKDVYNDVMMGKWPKTILTKEKVIPIPFKQSRATKVYKERVLEIADAIRANNGNTINCEPLIILEDRLGDGLHEGINGQHTKSGFVIVKNATQIYVIFIPKSVHKNIPDSLLTRLGNSFNKRNEKIKSDVEKDDVIKELMEEYADGYKHKDDDIRERVINELNFTDRQAIKFITLFKKKKKIYDADRENGKTYSKYSKKQLNIIKKEARKKYPNKTIWASSSSTLTLCRIYEQLRTKNSEDAHIIIHHPDSIAEGKWGLSKKTYFVENHTYSKSPLKIEYEEVSGWETDIVI